MDVLRKLGFRERDSKIGSRWVDPRQRVFIEIVGTKATINVDGGTKEFYTTKLTSRRDVIELGRQAKEALQVTEEIVMRRGQLRRIIREIITELDKPIST